MGDVRRHHEAVGAVQFLCVVTLAPRLDVSCPEVTPVEPAGDPAGMLILLNVETNDSLTLACLLKIRLLRRTDVGSLLNRRLGNIFHETAAHLLDDRPDDALELALEESTERRHHRRRHSR